MLTPVDFEKEIGVPNDLRQLKIIGSFAAVIGGVFIWLGKRSEMETSRIEAAD